MSTTIFAYCYASGQIEFGPRVPQGALAIAKGREDALRDLMCGTSRHAYDGETLLVPGVPEAPNQMAAVEKLIAFCDWLAERNTEGVEICGARKKRSPAAHVTTGTGAAMPIYGEG
ncbi:hypothetical protein [Paramagnetospirillum magneticum]|uniref:Host nuclease inhibitor protein n=1 Tax=Paramagnetospirillum magneticum (strain ATCC 700264 / AMB-1) TaxID=342108 RepID=Q2WA66_PARM1|nr:hypothetical protein [Paramagnetospirillum magneticum]BAE49259.1 hypothetical protein amb0455 [Paramagnetospirillum magneticum AMB-1]